MPSSTPCIPIAAVNISTTVRPSIGRDHCLPIWKDPRERTTAGLTFNEVRIFMIAVAYGDRYCPSLTLNKLELD